MLMSFDVERADREWFNFVVGFLWMMDICPVYSIF